MERASCCLCVSLSVLFFTHLLGTSPLAALVNKLIILCLIKHTALEFGMKKGAIRYSLLVELSLPAATNCHDPGEELSRSSVAVFFYSRPSIAYQFPPGPWPFFAEKETTAVAFTGFSNPRSQERERKSAFFFFFFAEI